MPLSPGTILGRYKVHSLLGAGGMGEVYLAQDIALNRKVALKVLPADVIGNRQRLSRFEQEARAASALNHPNIITIHEIGVEGDTHFIATEFIEGDTLSRKLKAGQLEISETLSIASQIAAALDAAHRSGIIHRDIKPENVMLREDGLVKVLDFGLAKLADKNSDVPADTQAPTRVRVKTTPGVVMGTVSYMSPEQARGKEVDARTDIFSFGVVLYEMLTGRLPFAGETVSDVIAAILKTEPPPLSNFTQEIPAELERIVNKTLEKDRDERYQTTRDLLVDLKGLIKQIQIRAVTEHSAAATNKHTDGENATRILDARPTSGVRLLTDKIKTHRRAFLLTLSVLILAAIGFGHWFFAIRSTTAKPIESLAVMPFRNESGNADVEYLSDGMTDTLISSLSRLPNLNVKARSSVFRYKGKETTPQTIGTELNVHAILNGRVVQRGDQLTLSLELVDARTENVIWSEQYNRNQADLVSLQSEIARDVSNKLRVKLSGADEQKLAKNYTANPEAYQLYLKGRFHLNKRTKQDIQKALEYFQQSVAADPNYAPGYAALAEIYQALQWYLIAPADEALPKAKDAVLKALSLDPELAEAHTALGGLMFEDGADAGAEREFQRAIELNPNYAATYHYYANLMRSQTKYEEALAMHRRALEIEPFSLIFNREYGSTLYLLRRYDEAIAQFKKTIELDAGYPSAHYNLSLVYWMKGNYPEAVNEQAKYQELIGEPQKAALLRESYAKGGWQGFLRMVADERRQFDLSWDDLTTYYAALGEKDKAVELLNEKFENHKIRPGKLNEPRLDPLRSDPRFQDFMRRAEFSK